MNSLARFFIYFFVIGQCYLINTVRCACCDIRNFENCPGVPRGSDINKCGDCSDGTPYCGYGKCNIFGCACKGGCRTGACDNCPTFGRRKRETATNTSTNADIVQLADKDQDGKLSVDEAVELLYVMQIAIPEDLIREGVVALDQNKDGFLLHSEIDPDN